MFSTIKGVLKLVGLILWEILLLLLMCVLYKIY